MSVTIAKNTFTPRTEPDDEIVQAICDVFARCPLYSGRMSAHFRPVHLPGLRPGARGHSITDWVMCDDRPGHGEDCKFGDKDDASSFSYGRKYRIEECDVHEAFRLLVDGGYSFFRDDEGYVCSIKPFYYNGYGHPYDRVYDFPEHFG